MPGLPVAEALRSLGWDDGWQAAYELGRDRAQRIADLAGGPAEPGRLARTDRAGGEVLTAGGIERVTWGAALITGSAEHGLPTTGDWVRLQHWADARVTVEGVMRRRTQVVRASASGTSQGQVLAANADHVAVVESLVPDVQVPRMERLLALAWGSGATPHLVLTKADLCDDGDAIARDLSGGVAAGVEVHVVAAPEGIGLPQLAARCSDGATLALLGGSGAGKSTLVNALVGAPIMATRLLGVAGKGRHTTVTRELHPTRGGGCVLDTPGLRGIGLAGEEGLDAAFGDIVELASHCRFRDCGHESEPGCAVLAAVESGELPDRRLTSWRKLRREAAWAASREDVRLRQARQREWRLISSQQRHGHVRP